MILVILSSRPSCVLSGLTEHSPVQDPIFYPVHQLERAMPAELIELDFGCAYNIQGTVEDAKLGR
jgi:hypothetical protein